MWSSLRTLATTLLVLSYTAVVNAVYDSPSNLPSKTDPEHGQVGFNDCQSRYGAQSPDALCQNIFINSIEDFCLYAPAQAGRTIADEEASVVSYCLRSGYGTRLIPAGTITGAHFVKTPSFVQVTGVGDLTKINIQPGDEGGELDPHGADGAGNPVGGLVYTRAFSGEWQRIYEWNHFISYNEFCFRACIGQYAAQWCPHIYDLMGCVFNNPGNYDPGTFDQCDGTEGEWPGVYNGSTWYQGVQPTPAPQPAGATFNCRSKPELEYGQPAIKVP